MRTWVDRGGTFTDVITCAQGEPPVVRKVPSDVARVGALAQGDLVMGTTVATNALLERQGVATLLIVTQGFEDLPVLRHMARPALFEPDTDWPPPLHTRVVGVQERVTTQGDVELALDTSTLEALDLSAFEAAAVVLMHSPRHPGHEHRIAAWLRDRAPHLSVSLGHTCSPEVGYLARIETTVLDASITPVLQAAITRDAIPPDALAIRSDGGLVRAAALRAPDAVLSGPAGGVLAVQAIAQQLGVPGAVGLDMGGTSTDVCCVMADALPRHDGDVMVAGVAVRRPMLEVDTIAAGGGSVCWSDGIQLRVGPQSAGAHPGPQSYGRGGPPTVTDAALALGLLDPLAFDPPLNPDAVDLPGDAQAWVDVARESMAAAIRRIAARRGLDITGLPLVAYGGAAGQHAADVADKLGMSTVVVHPFAAVLSAWGQVMARESVEHVEALWRPLAEAWQDVQARADALRCALPDGYAASVMLELRPRGTEHPLAVPMGDGCNEVAAAYATLHAQTYGVHHDGQDLEVVNLRVRGVRPGGEVPPLPPDAFGLGSSTRPGPCRIDTATTSVWVPAGWQAGMKGALLLLTRREARPRPHPTTRTPHGVSLWSSRFMAVAEQAGEHLVRLARSVNIRERRDFSCAVFDAEGRLVANAPHIPVHLGAMGDTVRDLMRHESDLPPGSAWLTNAPDAGGSHLPDLTVVTPVWHEGHRFFVASRGHHVDVGGITPGSMPPHSRTLSDEGLLFRRVPVMRDGKVTLDPAMLAGCRHPDVVHADLLAQVAANHHAAARLRELGPPAVLAAWMAHLQDAAEDAAALAIATLRPGQAEDALDGLPLQVRVLREGRQLTLDFTGTGGPHTGNLNAPRSVVRAAVLYALRVLVGDDAPLNEGALRCVHLRFPSPSLLSPPPTAAIVGGNVETSQRLVDLLFRAWGVRAGSQGTMNNLTLGGAGWSMYETLGGGQGACAVGPGLSGKQVHMTNTRATDPEVLETRMPVRLRGFALARGTGGSGANPGGDGLVREIEVLEPAVASLLATRRHTGAAGLEGGSAGRPGTDTLRLQGAWVPWDGRTTALAPGDRVRVQTPGGGGWGPHGDLA